MSITSVKDDINISNEIIESLSKKQFFLKQEKTIHFATGNKKRPSRTRLILINTLFAMQDEETNEISGSLNVNIQDNDPIWIEYLGEILQLFLDDTTVSNYRLEFTTEHLFKIADDLYFKNLKFKFTTI